MSRGWNNRGVWGWALYDWANSAYAIIVLAAILPFFYSSYYSPVPPELQQALEAARAAGDAAALAAAESAKQAVQATTTFRWGMANSVASAIAAVLAPILGAIADRSGRRRGMLLLFMGIGAAATAGLALIAQGQWLGASCVYVISGLGFAGSNVFYDALLVRVARREDRDVVSALGFGAGYLSSGLVLAFCAWMISHPEVLGLGGKVVATRLSFLIVGLWWAVFTVPLILWTPKDEPSGEFRLGPIVRDSLQEVTHTLRGLPRDRAVLLFLIAYWLYIDGVDTIIRMAANYGETLGMDITGMLKAILLLQFVAFPAAILYGRLGQWIGAKRALLLGVFLYCLLTVGAFFMRDGKMSDFYLLAVGVGLVQGGVQALSRSLYSVLVPPERASEYFGLYNLLGKSAAVLGPFLMGVITKLSGDPRYGILSLISLFALGGIVLLAVKVPAAAAAVDADGPATPA